LGFRPGLASTLRAMSGYEKVKRTGLKFKGEDDRLKKKRRCAGTKDVHGQAPLPELGEDGEDECAKVEEVSVVEGTGRIVTSSVTMHGFESAFKEEIEVGDTIMVAHPVSLQPELRVVVGILSQRSATLHQAFSKDLVSTTDFHIRKDSLKLKEKAKAQITNAAPGEETSEAAMQDATSKELQAQLEKKLRKQSKIVSVREKTGMWGYKTVTRKVSKATTEEEKLDERCKQGRDARC